MEKTGNPLCLLGFKVCSPLVTFSSSLQGSTLQPSLLLAGLWISHHPEGTAPVLGQIVTQKHTDFRGQSPVLLVAEPALVLSFVSLLHPPARDSCCSERELSP